MNRRVWIVVDLGFGDAGKGAVTDFLVRDQGAPLVVRYNGGAQAGHNVVTADGRHHTFSQVGAGTFAGARTLLGPAFLMHPLGLVVEAERLATLGVDVWPGLSVHAGARLITPYHQAAGRLRELARGDAAHGTCGVGVGECVADDLAAPEHTLRAADLRDRPRLRRILGEVRDRKVAELRHLGVTDLSWFDDPTLPDRVADAWAQVGARLRVVDADAARRAIDEAPSVVFEGAQGVLLDETWGFHPHTTWSDTTCAHALALVGDRPVVRLGVTRSYHTRHGAGPFPTDGTLRVPEPHNADVGWQGRFRTGALDLVLLRYALDVCPVDALALTHLDVLRRGPVATAYADPGPADLVADGRLRPGDRRDLAHRERLGRWLTAARPLLGERDVEDAVSALAPLWLRGAGPTAAAMGWVDGAPA